MKCIVCERELSSKKEGLYIKKFKGNWCHICISQSISFESLNLDAWVPQEYIDKGIRMKNYYMLSAIGKPEVETLEDRAILDNGYWAVSASVIGEYVEKKYDMEYRDFLMLLEKRPDSDQFIYKGTPNSKQFTREVTYFNRKMIREWGYYDEWASFAHELEIRANFLASYEEHKKAAAE